VFSLINLPGKSIALNFRKVIPSGRLTTNFVGPFTTSATEPVLLSTFQTLFIVHPRLRFVLASTIERCLSSVSNTKVSLDLKALHDGEVQSSARSEISEKNQEIEKLTLDVDRKSTTIWLWINWVQHLRLCLIQPGGR
jgi:hypothetical protein